MQTAPALPVSSSLIASAESRTASWTPVCARLYDRLRFSFLMLEAVSDLV